MRISITVKPNARRNEVSVKDDGGLLVCVTAPPVEGKANRKVIEVLASYFRKSKRSVEIVAGKSGKHKIVEIL